MAMKRVFDVTVSLLLLTLLFPVMALITMLVMMDGQGPVFYRQHRVGYLGRRFVMLKFRTMVRDRRTRNESINFPDRRRALKSDRDPRITPLGRLLRKTSLDELPQLFNVIRGDMSLVGPRPEMVDMLQYYRPEHHVRHHAFPGLTGWWQVNGRCRRASGCSPEEDLRIKLADDLHYLEHRSFVFDLQLLAKTIPVVVTGRGAA